MSYVAFVYEQWFDFTEHEDYDGYEGFSELNVVEIPDYDECDCDEGYDEDDYESVGSVLVGFNEEYGECLEADGDFDADVVCLYYPPL